MVRGLYQHCCCLGCPDDSHSHPDRRHLVPRTAPRKPHHRRPGLVLTRPGPRSDLADLLSRLDPASRPACHVTFCPATSVQTITHIWPARHDELAGFGGGLSHRLDGLGRDHVAGSDLDRGEGVLPDRTVDRHRSPPARHPPPHAPCRTTAACHRPYPRPTCVHPTQEGSLPRGGQQRTPRGHAWSGQVQSGFAAL
jgi:hypothetical protein